MAYIKLQNIVKNYNMGSTVIKALNKVSFTIDKGELVVVLGPSGAGKTTVLNILGGMDYADDGKIIVDDNNITTYNKTELMKYRRNDIGFVFQFYNLVQNLTALENVELATQICKNTLPPKEILAKVGLKDRMNNFPAQLSGGEQQRVSIARALAKNPKLLLCDEPTGALDSKTGRVVLEVLQNSNKTLNMTVVIITHNNIISEMADKVIKMKNGEVEEIIINENPKKVKDINW